MVDPGMSNLQDSFKQAADQYEQRMGIVTRAVARHIASAIELPPNARVCDNACGTGAVTESILQVYLDAKINAIDIAEPMTKILERVSQDRQWSDSVEVQVANSMDLPYPDGVFEAQIMNFGIFFTPDPRKAASEIYRTLKPGGTAVVTCWKDSVFFRLFPAIQELVQPVNPVQGMPVFDEWKDSQMIRSVMQAAGFTSLKIEEVPVHATLDTREELVQYCVGVIHSVIGNQWSSEEMSKLPVMTGKMIEAEGDKYFSTDSEGRTKASWVAWAAFASK